MPETPNKFFLTTPIYYVNARPHIGHAYTTIVADVIARRHRLLGDDTYFLTGTDEHGQKIERSALAAGVPPQQFTDEVSASFQSLWKRMGITNDDFIRTTEPRHQRGAQKLFADLFASGQIYLSSYTGQYSVGEEMFVEGPSGTIGPDGRPTETVTEENFFFRLSDYQERLINLIVSDDLAIRPLSAKNEVLMFVAGDYSNFINEYRLVAPENEKLPSFAEEAIEWCLSTGRVKRSKTNFLYVPGALRDVSVSRSSFTWGISVPEPAASQTEQKHVIYVWFDALANYMTALGYGSQDTNQFDRFWPADLHLVGKEITRFHCVYWPAFLIAADLQVPKAITANGWLLFHDSKMSKSKGNIVRTETILDAFGDRVYQAQFPDSTKREQDLFAADVLRYFLLREIPFGQDGIFSFEAMITRYNADLANGYGNLVSRTLNLIDQNYDLIPSDELSGIPDTGSYPDLEHKAVFWCGLIRKGFDFELSGQLFPLNDEWDELSFNGVLALLQSQVTRVDSFLTTVKPWSLAKETEVKARTALGSVLYTAAESIRFITALLYPVLPYATAKVWQQLGLGDIELAAKNGELTNLQWGGLKPGTKLGPLSPIFPRADKGLAQTMADMEQAAQQTQAQRKMEDPTHPAAAPRTASLPEVNPGSQVAASAALTTERDTERPDPTQPLRAPFMAEPHPAMSGFTPEAGPVDASPQITIDDFAKIELRVAQIIVAERIPKADKLLRLEVDLGYEKRQILSGIAEWYTPEDLLGRRIVVITNLAPRKMRGLDSHGMLLAASGPDGGKPALTTFADTDTLPLGSRLK